MLREHRVRAHGPGRLFAPDALRGLIIVLMALDHANIFIAHKHSSGEYWGGAFPVYNDALAFLTRFVTHFCAPGFFLLMGAGMALFAHSRQERGWTRAEIIRHFLIRGGALILLQLLVVNRAWELTPGGWGIQIYIGVLFALGANMVMGSLFLWLKPVYLLGLTGLLV
ncbi:MAG: heparan-alpha-glucosaminide N-acetyltransferase domain-containing protein, partial [Anaerolineales bacterium]